MTVWCVFDWDNAPTLDKIFETEELARNYIAEKAVETGWPVSYWRVEKWTVRGEDY